MTTRPAICIVFAGDIPGHTAGFEVILTGPQFAAGWETRVDRAFGVRPAA